MSFDPEGRASSFLRQLAEHPAPDVFTACMPKPATYAFGRFEVFPVRRQLRVDGHATAIGGRALDLLLTLIEHRDRMLTKNELLDLVWNDADVEPNNLAVQIGALRKLLGPDAIATIPGRGYRFGLTLDGSPGADPRPSPQPAGAAQLKTNLPETPTALIGRADDSAALETLLERHALVTITGAGGIGKSLLAQHLLHRRREVYPHGVCWVELAAVSEPGGLVGALAAAIGLQLGGTDPAAALRSALAPLSMLVALDNAEHLIEAVSGLAAALSDAAPMLRLVVTSQAPLHVAREQVYRLDALAVPPGGLTAALALSYGAVALFVDRAQAADARFVFDDRHVAAVIELCRRLDGLPLAIELAAARVPVLGVQRTLETLGERLELLTGGRRDAPARQQTLRAALDWSHGLLNADDQTVFRRLAVISGSASLEFIQRIGTVDDPLEAGSVPLDKWSVVDCLGTLIDRSLVAISAESDVPGSPRYRMLESPRAYAQERLREAGENERMAERHACAVGHLLEAAWEERFSGRIGVDAWRRSIQLDRDNARTALQWAMNQQDLPLLFKMAPVLLLRGTLGGSSHGERVTLAEALDAVLATVPPAPDQLRIRLSLVIFWHDAKPQRGLTGARCAMDLARQAGDRFAMYVLLSLTARVALRVGEAELSAASLAEMHAIEDPNWPPHRRFWGPEADGFCAVIRGDHGGESLLFFHRTLELARAAGDSAFAGRANLVAAELAAGNAVAAAAAGQALVELLQQTRDEFTLTIARVNLVAAWLALDDLAAARPVAEAGWRKAADFGMQAPYGDYLALMAALEERWTVSARLAGYSTAAYAKQNSPRWQIEARAFERATAMSRAALGSADFERLVADGAELNDDQIAVLAFGDDAAKEISTTTVA